MARGRKDGRWRKFLACWSRTFYSIKNFLLLLFLAVYFSLGTGQEPIPECICQLCGNVEVNCIQSFLLAVPWCCSASGPEAAWQPQVKQHQARLCLLGSSWKPPWTPYHLQTLMPHPWRCARQMAVSVPTHPTFPCYIFETSPSVCASYMRHTSLHCPALPASN